MDAAKDIGLTCVKFAVRATIVMGMTVIFLQNVKMYVVVPHELDESGEEDKEDDGYSSHESDSQDA